MQARPRGASGDGAVVRAGRDRVVVCQVGLSGEGWVLMKGGMGLGGTQEVEREVTEGGKGGAGWTAKRREHALVSAVWKVQEARLYEDGEDR